MYDLAKGHKTFSAAGIILALLFFWVAETHFANLGKADPCLYLGNVPPDSNTKPPEISILHPENNTIFANNCVFLNFTISVGPLTTGSYLNIYDAGYKADWKPFDQWVNPEITEFSFNLTDIPDGNHSITVHAAEEGSYIPAQGSSNPMTRNDFYINGSSSVFFIVDTTPPNVTLLSIDTKTYYNSDIPLDFMVNEVVSQINYSLDGQDNITVAGNFTLTRLPYGEHNVTVYATDIAGNVGVSETITFTIAEQEAFPTAIVATASGASLAIIGVGLIVYFKKRKH